MSDNTLRLTDDELQALRETVWALRVSKPDVAAELGVGLLESLELKAATAFEKKRCAHCCEIAGTMRKGHCGRCNSYERKYGVLPSAETLARSARRPRSDGPKPTRPRARQRLSKPGSKARP